MQPKLGILAGGGDLPVRLVAALKAANRPYFIIAFKDQAAEDLVRNEPHAWVRLGAAGSAIETLRAEGCEDLVMAGRINRPSFPMLMPDAWTASFFARHGMSAFGDDGLLSALIRDLEEREGFRVLSVDSLLPDILATAGCYTKTQPNDEHMRDISRGLFVARGIGALDVGQGCVVQAGLVLAVEAIEGTEAMVARSADLKREGPGGVLIKVKKPDQEKRADLPSIGPDTVRQAKQAGLSGIAIEQGGAIIIDKDQVIKDADQAGLFVIGIAAAEPE